MMHGPEQTSKSWGFGGWLKDIFGKKLGPEGEKDLEEKDSDLEASGNDSEESSSSSSSDEDGGIKIPIPEIPSRVFSKH